MPNFTSTTERVNMPSIDELLNELQPAIDTATLLKNLIAILGKVDYTSQYELDKYFRILKRKQGILNERGWKNMHILRNNMIEEQK